MVGGGVALLHYLDYRETKDLDAWWNDAAKAASREGLASVVETLLASEGEVKRRTWGDVLSIDLRQEGAVIFKFQVAKRSARLTHGVQLPWAPVEMDALPDIVASKMVALVERGAPRDFRDIRALCVEGLVAPVDCWDLWKHRQHLADGDATHDRALAAIALHLERIEKHRPLLSVADAAARKEAMTARQWFREALLGQG